jgi:hypothetical protein
VSAGASEPVAYRVVYSERGVRLIRRVADVCRAAWPVQPVSASAAAVARRRQLAELWLYDDFTLPQDWLWFVSESG